MITSLQLHLSKVFLKIFLRNRQAILFSLFFPLIFIGAFSFSGSEPQPFLIGVEDKSNSPFSSEFRGSLEQEDLFTLIKVNKSSCSKLPLNSEEKGELDLSSTPMRNG